MINISRPSEWRSLEGNCYEVGHTWSSSCVYSWLEMVAFLSYEGMKIYLPLHLVSDLARGKLLKNLMNGSTFKDVLRSSLFLGINGGLFIFAICTLRRVLGRFYFYTVGFLPGVISAVCSLLVEKKARRGLLAGYTLCVSLDFLFSLLKNRHVITPLPYGDVLLFSSASSFLFYHYKSQSSPGDVISSMLRVLMSPYVPGPIVRALQGSVLDNQWTYIVLVGVWAFLLGYLLQSLFSLTKGIKLLGQKGTLGRLHHAVFNHRNVKFGAFLGSMSAGFLALSSLLRYLSLPRPARLLLAGFVAGLSMAFVRSRGISLYVAWKSLEMLFFEGVKRGYFRSWYYADILIYGLSTGIIYHSAFFHAHHLSPAYWSFLMSGTGGRVSQLDHRLLDMFGTEASIVPRREAMKAQQRAAAQRAAAQRAAALITAIQRAAIQKEAIYSREMPPENCRSEHEVIAAGSASPEREN